MWNEIILKKYIETKLRSKWSLNGLSFWYIKSFSKRDDNDVIFLSIKITLKKLHRNDIDFSLIEIVSKKVRRKDIDFLLIKIASNKVRRNTVDFWPIEITSKKVCQNDIDYSTIEVTSKKYIKMTWKFVDVFSSRYWRNIAIKSTSIRCGVSVGKWK